MSQESEEGVDPSLLWDDTDDTTEIDIPDWDNPDTIFRLIRHSMMDILEQRLMTCSSTCVLMNSTRNNTNETPLMFAARLGNIPAIDLLMKYGSLVDFTNSKGLSAIMFAGMYGQAEALFYLHVRYHATMSMFMFDDETKNDLLQMVLRSRHLYEAATPFHMAQFHALGVPHPPQNFHELITFIIHNGFFHPESKTKTCHVSDAFKVCKLDHAPHRAFITPAQSGREPFPTIQKALVSPSDYLQSVLQSVHASRMYAQQIQSIIGTSSADGGGIHFISSHPTQLRSPPPQSSQFLSQQDAHAISGLSISSTSSMPLQSIPSTSSQSLSSPLSSTASILSSYPPAAATTTGARQQQQQQSPTIERELDIIKGIYLNDLVKMFTMPGVTVSARTGRTVLMELILQDRLDRMSFQHLYQDQAEVDAVNTRIQHRLAFIAYILTDDMLVKQYGRVFHPDFMGLTALDHISFKQNSSMIPLLLLSVFVDLHRHRIHPVINQYGESIENRLQILSHYTDIQPLQLFLDALKKSALYLSSSIYQSQQSQQQPQQDKIKPDTTFYDSQMYRFPTNFLPNDLILSNDNIKNVIRLNSLSQQQQSQAHSDTLNYLTLLIRRADYIFTELVLNPYHVNTPSALRHRYQSPFFIYREMEMTRSSHHDRLESQSIISCIDLIPIPWTMVPAVQCAARIKVSLENIQDYVKILHKNQIQSTFTRLFDDLILLPFQLAHVALLSSSDPITYQESSLISTKRPHPMAYLPLKILNDQYPLSSSEIGDIVQITEKYSPHDATPLRLPHSPTPPCDQLDWYTLLHCFKYTMMHMYTILNYSLDITPEQLAETHDIVAQAKTVIPKDLQTYDQNGQLQYTKVESNQFQALHSPLTYIYLPPAMAIVELLTGLDIVFRDINRNISSTTARALDGQHFSLFYQSYHYYPSSVIWNDLHMVQFPVKVFHKLLSSFLSTLTIPPDVVQQYLLPDVDPIPDASTVKATCLCIQSNIVKKNRRYINHDNSWRCEALFIRGYHPDVRDASGATLLMRTCSRGEMDHLLWKHALYMLLAYGANIYTLDFQHQSILYYLFTTIRTKSHHVNVIVEFFTFLTDHTQILLFHSTYASGSPSVYILLDRFAKAALLPSSVLQSLVEKAHKQLISRDLDDYTEVMKQFTS